MCNMFILIVIGIIIGVLKMLGLTSALSEVIHSYFDEYDKDIARATETVQFRNCSSCKHRKLNDREDLCRVFTESPKMGYDFTVVVELLRITEANKRCKKDNKFKRSFIWSFISKLSDDKI